MCDTSLLQNEIEIDISAAIYHAREGCEGSNKIFNDTDWTNDDRVIKS